MSSKEINRVVFHSKEDMATSHNLIKAEKLLNSFNSEQISTINDLLELYNIQLYFENDLFLTRWSEIDKKKYFKILDENWSSLKERLLKINDQNIIQILNELEFNYKSNFWDLINKLYVFKNLSKSKFGSILNDFAYHINYILPQKNIVQKFDKEIKNFLMSYQKSAEILLSKFEEKKSDRNTPKYYFPKSLSIDNKENIMNAYLENKEANLNYIRLIEKSKDSNDLKLSDKTRYKAKKKSEELNNEILEKGHTWSIRVQVGLSKDLDEPAKFDNSKGLLEVTYSEKFLDNLEDNLNLFKIFSQLFNYTDETSLITLVSKKSELDVMERIFMKSKNEYETGEVFTRKEYLSILQLHIFNNYLERKNRGIEQLINDFIKHLNDIILPHKLTFQVRNSYSSYIEKIRTLLPEFDFLLKQYKNLAEDGSIDLELLQVSSKPIGFSQITSQLNKKYIYSNDNLILQLKYLFFSDQSHLFYTETFGSKYNNLFDLITKEKVTIENFASYQKDTIQSLINDGYLKINNENNIEIEKITLIYIIRELHRNELLNYWHYPKFVRDEIDLMIKQKLVFVENTLLSREEKNYFNFYLNKKEYTNGYDLRNKYLHGTNALSEEQHKNDYYLLLKILILALLKIEDDALINKKTTDNN